MATLHDRNKRLVLATSLGPVTCLFDMATLEATVEATLSTLQAEPWKSQPFTMFRVPAYVRKSDRTAYEPRVVSIGPYYHGHPSLRALEDHKWRYLHDFLGRNRTAMTPTSLIREMRSMEARARGCYSERPLLDSSDDFVRMLLLDGCFILELFFKCYDKEPDKLCDTGWGLTFIITDLLLLENQIPFFVVERLYELVTDGQGSREHLLNLLLEYMDSDKPISSPSRRPSFATREIDHLLHLHYENFVPKRPPVESSLSETQKLPAMRLVPRAEEMSIAGVTFVRRSPDSARDMYDVEFHAKTGVMEIPTITVDETKRTLLINLIAFEQSQGAEEARVVTSYVSLMGMLVRTARDVELLRRSNVVDNLLADDDEAARFFSHLLYGGAMNYEQQVFTALCDDVRRYCISWRHRNRATLMRDYFGSPWSAISVIAAALVVALTATQTYFAVFPSKN